MRNLKIGISASFYHKGSVHQHKTMVFAEEGLLQWLGQAGVMPYLIPRFAGGISIKEFLSDLDGVILSGGADISPKSYGEEALKPEWAGDFERDQYDLEVFNTAIEMNKPILGICRGHQLINVAMGGTMYQDIDTQVKVSIKHRDREIYDDHDHELEILENTTLADIYKESDAKLINSIHHQAIKDLGRDLITQAISKEDRLIESIKLDSKDRYALGVQWHPEWIKNDKMLNPNLILDHFLSAVKDRIK